MKKYKFIRSGYKSDSGNHKWKVGEWYECDGDVDMCHNGFHCSKGIYQAFSYVQGEILAEVEVKGKHESQIDKEVWQKMRVVKTYRWNKKDSVLFSIYCARLCLKNFEKEFPDDKRPREAIEAAEKYVKNPTAKNKLAARSAAESAELAESAARSAARSAESAELAELAAWSAWSAAWPAWPAELAAWSARSAARSASSAARSAESAELAELAFYKKLDKYMKNHLKELRVLKEKK